MKPFLVLLSLFLSMPWAAYGAGYVSPRECAMKIQKDRAQIELVTTACVGIRDSKTCQNFYKTLDDEDEKKKLTCSSKEIVANVNGSYLGDAALICAAGIIVDPVVALGTGIGEEIAKIEIAWEKASECNKSMDQKTALILAYNMDVPKLLKYDMPDREKLEKITCNMINGSLQMHKRNSNKKYFNKLRAHYVSSTGKNSLNEDEVELMEYNKKLADDLLGKRQGNISKMVEEMVKDLNLSLECYNPAQALAIRCEIAATIASVAIPSLFAIKAARLAKLTKVRLAKVEESAKDLTNLGRDGRIAKAQTEIATLGKEEKLNKLESEIGRSNKPLNEKEVKAYEKAHNVKSDDGEFYGTYSGKSLREKKRVLMEEGGFSEVEADFMIKRGYVGDAAPVTPPRVSINTSAVIKDPKLKQEVDKLISNESVSSRRLAADKLNAVVGYERGVVQNVEVKAVSDSAARGLEKELIESHPADKVMKTSHREAKDQVSRSEEFILDPDKPYARPDQQVAHRKFENAYGQTQTKYEDAATLYIRAGKKEEALAILQKSPIVENLSTGGRGYYIQQFLKKVETSQRPK